MAIPLLVAGAVVQGIGAMKQGEANADAANYNANAAGQQAQVAQQSAGIDEAAQRRNASRVIGGMRANVASSGLQQTGSVEDMIADSAATAEFDALMIRRNGQIQAGGYANQASLDRTAASNARTGSYFSAAGALIGGGAKALDVAWTLNGQPKWLDPIIGKPSGGR